MEPKRVERKEMRVMGLKTRTSRQVESNYKSARIPKLWDRFYDEKCLSRIPKRSDPDVILGLYSSYQNDYLGEYDLLIGAQVSDLQMVPGLSSEIVLPGPYLLFKAKGQMPKAVLSTWEAVWDHFADPRCPHQRAYKADLEWYHATRPNEVDLYISIK